MTSKGTVLMTVSRESAEIIIKNILSTDGQHGSSSLINGLDIINELIRRADLAKSFSDLSPINLDALIELITEHLPQFFHYLQHPKTRMSEISMTVGKIQPLGIERLKLCEAFTEFIRLNVCAVNDKLAELKVSITILVLIISFCRICFSSIPGIISCTLWSQT